MRTPPPPPPAPLVLEFFRLAPRVAIPTKAHPSDIGWDIQAHLLSEGAKELTKPLNQRCATLIPTGLSVRPPEGYYVQVCSRSGWASKGVFVANAPGIIDPNYTGEIKVILFNGSFETHYVRHGMRIAQLVLAPICPSVLGESKEAFRSPERGDSGFGSSGA